MKYEWFNIGKIEIWIDPELYYPKKNGNPHYKIQLLVTTKKWFRIFSKIDVCIESLIEVDKLRPLQSYRNFEAQNKIDIRHDYFSYADSIAIKAYIEDIDTWRYHKFAKENIPIKDVLSTYMWIRTQPKERYNREGKLKIFFGNDTYNLTMLQKKRTTYTYNNRDIRALKIGFILPGKYFKKVPTGYVFLSDDFNRLLLKVEINMTLGSFVFDLKTIEKIKY